MAFHSPAPRRHRRASALALAAAASLLPTPAARADEQWNNSIVSGNWSVASNWGGNALPNTGDNVFLLANDAVNRTVTLDVSTTFLTLQIRNNGAGTFTLSESANVSFNPYYGFEAVGSGPSGHGVHLQSAGTNTYATDLSVGDGAGGSGLYSLSDTGSVNVTGTGPGPGTPGLFVGYDGSGTFNQSGSSSVTLGSASNQIPLYLGYHAGSLGNYSLSGSAVLSDYGTEHVGLNGNATFTQSGGLNSVTSSLFGTGLFVGAGAGSTGSYTLQGPGTLSVQASEYVGLDGHGAFNQSGGLNHVPDLRIAVDPLSVGIYSLIAGTLLTSYTELVGQHGSGSFVQTGGTHSTTAPLFIADASDGAGTYTLNSAAAQFLVNNNTYVGGDVGSPGGAGTLNVSAGSMTVTNALKIWDTSGTQVNLSGGSLTVGSLDTSGNPARFLGNRTTTGWTGGTLAVTGANGLYVGSSPTGPLGSSFTLPAGQSLVVSNSFSVGASGNDGSAGTLIQTGGSLAVLGAEYVAGLGSTGLVSQSGGTATLGSGLNPFAVSLVVDANPGRNATYSLSGSASLNVYGLEFVGWNGTGTFVQTGGTHTVLGELDLPALPTFNSSSYTLSGGSLSLTTLYMPFGGTFLQTGGSFHYSSVLQSGGTATFHVGLNVDNASYSLSSGTLTVTGESETVGLSGTASLAQSGGSHTVGTPLVNQPLFIGANVGAAGSYSLSGSGSLITYGGEYVGDAGTGTLTQTGGTNNVYFSYLYVAYAASSTGTYSLSGTGVLNVHATEFVGFEGNGTFVQSGGTNVNGETAAQHLVIGSNGATGAYSLSGTGLLAVAGSEYVGFSGTGSFVQTGGTNALANQLYLAYAAGSSGTYTLSGGSLAAAATTINSGGALDFGGGSASLGSVSLTGTGRILLAPAAGSPRVLRVTALNLPQPTSEVDLNDNKMVWDYAGTSPINSLRSYIYVGTGFGTGWSASCLTSTAAQLDPQHRTALGYGEASQLLHLSGATTTTWFGQTVDATSLLVKYTYYGDANLDGEVNADDYALLDKGLANHLPNAHWTDGDFNYDGTIDSRDYLLIDRSYALQGNPLSPDFLAAREAQFGTGYVQQLIAAVPEPCLLTLLSCLPAFARRRRQRSGRASSRASENHRNGSLQ